MSLRRVERVLVTAMIVTAAALVVFLAAWFATAEAHGTGCHSKACRERVAAKYWEREQRALSPSMKALLKRLRGCETRGIPFPHNYRNAGHHFGAYQYSWGRGSAGERAGFRVRPDRASPAEQDVRTARFFPSHRSEWTCRA